MQLLTLPNADAVKEAQEIALEEELRRAEERNYKFLEECELAIDRAKRPFPCGMGNCIRVTPVNVA